MVNLLREARSRQKSDFLMTIVLSGRADGLAWALVRMFEVTQLRFRIGFLLQQGFWVAIKHQLHLLQQT